MSLPVDIEKKYQALHKLGEGGMGAVYQVRHRLLGELRVIKLIQPQHAGKKTLRRRFRHEAQAAIRLRHPNVAQVHDFSIDDTGTAYIVMEFIDGVTFAEVLKRGGPPPLGLVAELAIQSLGALGYLHQQGYLHRDISPDNLMLTRNYDGGPLVKLIDLGLAKRLTDGLDLTSSGLFVGKARYASPEQFGGTGTLGPPSDLYSFGAVLYQLLTGQCPVRGSSFEELVASHLLRPVIGFDESDPEGRVPEGLRTVLLQALDKNPDQRMASADEFIELLQPFQTSDLPTFDELAETYGHSEEPVAVDESERTPTAVTPIDARALDAAAAEATPEILPTEPNRSDRGSGETSGWAQRWSGWRGLAAAGGLALISALAVWLGPSLLKSPSERMSSRPSTAPQAAGSLLIDAVPWAEIVGLTGADGLAIPLDAALSTPALIPLPPGTYEITLRNEDFPALPPTAVEVRAGTTETQTMNLGQISIDAYFEGVGLHSMLEQAGY